MRAIENLECLMELEAWLNLKNDLIRTELRQKIMRNSQRATKKQNTYEKVILETY